jgi:hypothetical protein
MKTYSEAVREIVRDVARTFPSFGGDRGAKGNPIAAAMQNEPPSFALGVDVEQVVRFVLESAYTKGFRQ